MDEKLPKSSDGVEPYREDESPNYISSGDMRLYRLGMDPDQHWFITWLELKERKAKSDQELAARAAARLKKSAATDEKSDGG
jgi:hypothetical protein